MCRVLAEQTEFRGQAKSYPHETGHQRQEFLHSTSGKGRKGRGRKKTNHWMGKTTHFVTKELSESKSRLDSRFVNGSCLNKYQLQASPHSALRPPLDESHSSVHFFFCRYSRRRQVSTVTIGIPLDAVQKGQQEDCGSI